MPVITAWKVGASFANTIGATDKLAFSNAAGGFTSFAKNSFNPATVVINASLVWSADGKNLKYVSPTQIDKGSGTVTLNTSNIATGDCTLKIEWADDAMNTALSNARFYAYNGSDPAVAPANMTVVAFERAASAINKNRISGDSAGKAWDAAYGIGGSANALALSDQASGASHTFYIGISAKPTTYGKNTAMAFRIEFDVE